MHITHTLESLSIKTYDDKLFTELSNMINKNFQNTISSKGRVISFYEENEMPQRKYFLKFIKKIYEKQNKDELNIQFAEYKTIKLNYMQKNTLTNVIFAKVFFEDDEVIFRLQKSNNLFFGYLLQTFKNREFKINDSKTRLNIKITSDKDCDILQSLFEKKEYLDFIVEFDKDDEKFDKFKRNFKVKKSAKFINRFSALASLLEDNFKVLDCKIDSSFDDIRQSYLDLVKIYHPDRHANKSENIKDVYRKKFEQIQNAYESLKSFFKTQENFISA
ncbi:putative DnaJ domain protein [Campylobacter pinnipediorum subsp. pinnipediorum]|uniref:adenylosuccinate lyase n=1 Tax=Campylobacter pinnipediorum TaxID=1965231 RepID=UPI0009950296|nr:adenylosuccinate lyase [Campylobacter pinnipediorum]AQW81207.1 putative DnaJ domain protein [Campylobacter pinnipediorum subsp. pinnipediorum]AQW84511.1 putative DnaJ domain protein [Campylobacter pinnipediorum subsp. pinnipediorum]